MLAVVDGLAWPSSAAAETISTPFRIMVEAAVCRNACGWIWDRVFALLNRPNQSVTLAKRKRSATAAINAAAKVNNPP